MACKNARLHDILPLLPKSNFFRHGFNIDIGLTFSIHRRFRQLVDLFIEEYVDDQTVRSEKTKLVRTVVKIVYENGYRFLKPDEEGVFAELGMKHVLKKVSYKRTRGKYDELIA